MKISYNAAAMRASNALNASDSKVSKSLGRLSSGLKVTTSKDNPSGYAIGRRMNAQITGINTATQSSNNGISVIETADGALTEVHEMLQRMNELAVKGETGTLTTGDRMTLEAELKQLKQEITRISTDTQFNGQTLLDGTFDLRGYTNNNKVKVDYYSDEVLPKKYSITELNIVYGVDGKIDKDATTLTLGPEFPAGVEISETTKDKITLKGPADFEMTIAIDVEPEPILDADGNVTGYESVSPLHVDQTVISTTTLPSVTVSVDVNGDWDLPAIKASVEQAIQQAFVDGTAGDMPADTVVTNMRVGTEGGLTIDLGSNADPNFRVSFGYGKDYMGTAGSVTKDVDFDKVEFSTEPLIIDATGIGAMDTQTGANEGQQLAIRIPTISLDRMGLEDTKMTTVEECAEANKAIRGAILYVSDARSRLGAYQNRLEHTVNNLAVSNENMTSSYSRIMDVDMAEEMTAYTTEQVISQAAVSMLAQANERPSQVLQLLQ